MEIYCETVKGFHKLTFFVKALHLRCLKVFQIRLWGGPLLSTVFVILLLIEMAFIHLRTFPWEDIFNLGFSNAPSEFCYWTQIKKDIWKQSADLPDLQSLNDLRTCLFTAWKVSVFWVILVRIFPHSDWIWTRITPNAHSFYAVVYVNKISSIHKTSAEQH